MGLKKTVTGALTVIAAFFVVPAVIFAGEKDSEGLDRLAAASAGLMGGRQPAFQSASVSTVLPPGSEISAVSYWDIALALEEKEPESTTSEVPSPLPAEDVEWALPYPEGLTDRDGVIEKYTYGHYDDERFFDLESGGQVRNCTDYSNEEIYELSRKGLPFDTEISSEEPLVLIYHTHATESFELEDRSWYDKDFSSKTTMREKNIISVGDRICEMLDRGGIPYIHDTLVHDYPDYNNAYRSSRAAVEEILREYPSIKICLDVHRDGIEREDGTRIAPVADIGGREAAQIMLISCADDGSGNIPYFRENFAFACTFQQKLETMWPGLTRPVLFDCRYYNQDLSTGSLLIEVGSHGNSLDQAQYSGELIGRTLVSLFGKETD